MKKALFGIGRASENYDIQREIDNVNHRLKHGDSNNYLPDKIRYLKLFKKYQKEFSSILISCLPIIPLMYRDSFYVITGGKKYYQLNNIYSNIIGYNRTKRFYPDRYCDNTTNIERDYIDIHSNLSSYIEYLYEYFR